MPTLQDYIELARQSKAQIRTIYETIEGEVNDDVTLDNLDTISKTSVEGLWIYIPAFCTWFFEQYVLVDFKKGIQDTIDNNTNLNDRWWATEIKKFQDGDTVLFNDATKRPYYAVIDTSKQIIKYAAVVSNSGLTTVKVAKEGKVKLSNDEMSRLSEFGNDSQPSGANIQYETYNPDKLKAPIKVYFNALRTVDYIQPIVEAAIINYLDNLPYNGRFRTSAYVDAIQKVIDVVDVEPLVFEAKPEGSSDWIIIDRVYDPLSGTVDISTDLSLIDAVTYIPVSSNG